MGEMEGEIKINKQTNKTPTKPKICFNSVQFHHFHENPKEEGKEGRKALAFPAVTIRPLLAPSFPRL